MPSLSLSSIQEKYRSFFCAPEDVQVGIEWERSGIYRADHTTPVPYSGEKGYKKILEGLHAHYGWEIEEEENGNIFTLLRGKTRITIEGDGKPEISGAPFASLLENKEELISIGEEISSLAKPLGIEFLAQGISPFFHHDEIQLVPKTRYRLWDEFFPNPQDHEWMHRYMKNLCGVHFNMSCTSEEDLIQKTQTLFRLSPIISGVFANSPFQNKKPSGVLSTRRKATFTNSFGRERMMEGMLEKNFSLEQWIHWYALQDLYIVVREKKTLPVPKGFSFQNFLERGFEGETAVFEDFDVHLKTCWTDIRFRKGYIEFRPLDTLEIPEMMSAMAFLTGILSSDEGFGAVQEVTKEWKEKDFPSLHEKAWTYGGKAIFNGHSFFELLEMLLPVSLRNLQKRNKGEEHLLDPLFLILEKKETPAERLLHKGFKPLDDDQKGLLKGLKPPCCEGIQNVDILENKGS